MAMFSGFKPSGMQKIANKMGYDGPMDGSPIGIKSFNDFVLKDPARKTLMDDYVTKAIHMASGGSVPSMTAKNTLLKNDQVPNDLTLNPSKTLTWPTTSNPSINPATSSLPATYTPPVATSVPVTSSPSVIPQAKSITDTDITKPKAETFTVPSSFQLYNPAYIDPVSGKVKQNLLGGKHTDPNTIPENVLQSRYVRREQGYEGDWGEGGATEFATPSFRNFSANYLNPNSNTEIRSDLLGGAYTDPNTIPEDVLKKRLQLRNAGYKEPWGKGGATNFLLGPETPAFRGLASHFLNETGTAISDRLFGGATDRQQASSISPDVLRQRYILREAGYQSPWGSRSTSGTPLAQEWLSSPSNKQDWENEVRKYQNKDISVKSYRNNSVALEDVPEVQAPALASVTAPDVFLPTIKEREYTQQEIDSGTPTYHQRLRTAFGYTGDFGGGGFGTFFQDYLTKNPDAQKTFDTITQEYQQGFLSKDSQQSIVDISADRMKAPGLPTGAVTVAAPISTSADQFIDPVTGQLFFTPKADASTAVTGQAQSIAPIPSATIDPSLSTPAVTTAAAGMQAAQLGGIAPEATIQAQTATESSVSDLSGQQGAGIVATNDVNRNIQAGEVISETSNAETAAAFTEQIEAATATPSTQATVQGQLASLTDNFDASNPPSWAAGAIRAANEVLAQRGLGASSMAGQAIIQATLEAALPLAQADASIFAQFETQNLSNRQQRAMLSAQQRASFLSLDFDQGFQTRVQNAARVSDIANLNFTADQQIQLENSRIANTVNLQNLSNRQAITLAEASALANLDTGNLNNRQQAAVQNAQNFLQMDLTNLSNEQQTELFKNQQTIQALFTDQAATNAAAQFNASSENQVNQFFSSLEQQARQYNVTQENAQSQFNAGQENVISRFNAQIQNERDQFNATNRLAVDQSNAVWRRAIATADTAAVNRVNEINASALLGISNEAYNDLWQFFADEMDAVLRSSDNERTRINNLAIASLNNDAALERANLTIDAEASKGFGSIITSILTADDDSIIGSFLPGF
tara:strand:- start:6982 stop:10098 length:3117 start_codon:yes stop_codon:yes gene_type:complete